MAGKFIRNMVRLFHFDKRGEIMGMFNQSKAIEKLNELWSNKFCPICGNTSWVIDEDLFSPVMLNDNGIHIGVKAIPMCLITCTKCGYVFHMNAKVLGCIDDDQQNEGGELNELTK